MGVAQLSEQPLFFTPPPFFLLPKMKLFLRGVKLCKNLSLIIS